MSDVGRKIAELRAYHKLSRPKFAKICGVSQNTLINYETGRNMPGFDFIEKLADRYQVSLEYFDHDMSVSQWKEMDRLRRVAYQLSCLEGGIKQHYEELIQFDYGKSTIRKDEMDKKFLQRK